MKKKTIFSAIAVVLVATIAIVGINLRNNQNSGNKIETIEPVKASSNTTATFFFRKRQKLKYIEKAAWQ